MGGSKTWFKWLLSTVQKQVKFGLQMVQFLLDGYELQWASEYQTSLVFRSRESVLKSKHLKSELNSLDFKW
jgi:hypothetical protein